MTCGRGVTAARSAILCYRASSTAPTLKLVRTTFKGCHADAANGGAVCMQAGTKFLIAGCSFVNNYCADDKNGGAVYHADSE